MSYQGQSPKVNRLRLNPRSSDPVNPSEGDLQYADGSVREEGVWVYKNSAWVKVGSDQAGDINYVSNGDAEAGNTAGWSLGTVTLTSNFPSGAPTFGSGASANLSFSNSASSPLAGTRSFQYASSAASTAGNFLASDAFTIDAADLAKVLSIDITYKVTAGTVNMSGTSSNSFGVAIYDVTASAWIMPAGVWAMTQSSGAGRAVATFQTPTTSTQYRLVLFNANATSTAFTMQLDRIAVGPQSVPVAAPVTDWQSFTPTGSWTTNTTYSGSWRRVGQSMDLQIRLALAGAPTAANLTVNMPSGYTIDTAALLTTTVGGGAFGNGGIWDNGTGNYTPIVAYNSSSSFLIKYSGTSNNGTVNATTPMTFANNDEILLNVSVPVSGWSSQVQMSSDTDTRVVAAIVSGDPASATSGNPIIVPTVSYDSHGAYNATTGRYTCPVTGIYKIFGALQSASAATTLTVYKNAVSTALAGSLDSNGEATFCASVNCSAGDIIDLRPGGTVDATNITLNIERLSGPAVVAATESINARYSTTAGQSISSGATAIVNFGTSTYDSHSAVTTGASWKFTAPATGKYRVSANIVFASGTWSATQQPYLNLYKNGAQVSAGPLFYVSATGSWVIPLGLTDTVQLNAGDYIDIRVLNASSNTQALSTNAWQNYVSVNRVGN